MLGTIVKENTALSTALKNQIKAAASAALRDREGAIRQSATAVLARSVTPTTFPIWSWSRRTTRGVLLDTGERRYFVREAAQKAIARIRQRSSLR
jgi:hypothetical protein